MAMTPFDTVTAAMRPGPEMLRNRNPFEASGRPGQTPEAGARGGMPTFTPHPDVARMAEAARNGARVQAPYGGGIGGQPPVPPADWQRTMAPGAAPMGGMATQPGIVPGTMGPGVPSANPMNALGSGMAPPPGSFAGGPQIPPRVLQNIMQMLQQQGNQGPVGGQLGSIMQMLQKLAPFSAQGQGGGTMMQVPPAPMQTWNPGGTQMPAPPVPMQTWTPSPGGSGSTAPFPAGIGW